MSWECPPTVSIHGAPSVPIPAGSRRDLAGWAGGAGDGPRGVIYVDTAAGQGGLHSSSHGAATLGAPLLPSLSRLRWGFPCSLRVRCKGSLGPSLPGGERRADAAELRDPEGRKGQGDPLTPACLPPTAAALPRSCTEIQPGQVSSSRTGPRSFGRATIGDPLSAGSGVAATGPGSFSQRTPVLAPSPRIWHVPSPTSLRARDWQRSLRGRIRSPLLRPCGTSCPQVSDLPGPTLASHFTVQA